MNEAPLYIAPLVAVCAVYLAAWIGWEWLQHLRSDDGALGRAEHRRRVARAATHRRANRRRIDLRLVLLPDPAHQPLSLPRP